MKKKQKQENQSHRGVDSHRCGWGEEGVSASQHGNK